MKKQMRGNDYLLPRLKNEHPAIYADLQAGKFKSERQAFIAAGLKRPPTRLNVLKNAWAKASVSEQAEFRRLIGISTIVGPSLSPSLSLPAPRASLHTPKSTTTAIGPFTTIHTLSRLQPWARARIETIMSIRKMKMGEVMAEMGCNKLNPALGNALRGNTRIQTQMAGELEQWLDDNKNVR